MPAAGVLYVEAPQHIELPYGLLSVADVNSVSDVHVLNGAEWEVDTCGIASIGTQPCVGTNEVETISITGTPTGGTYTLTFEGLTTLPITYNSNAATVQAALIALGNLEPGDVTITGTYPSFTATFGGQYSGVNVPQMTATASLTGGTTPGVTIATTTQGSVVGPTTTPKGSNATAYPVNVYVDYECRALGEFGRAKDRAVRMLNQGEGRALEKTFWQTTLDAAGTTDLTPATTTAPEVGLATLEGYAADNYGFAATIHMPRNLASILMTRQAVERHGNHLETGLGNLVAAGAGYSVDTGPNGVAPTANETWMYVTGTVAIWRGNATVGDPFFVTSTLDNTIRVMASRNYVVGTECLLAALRVKDA